MKVWVIKKTFFNPRVAGTTEQAAKIIAEMLNEEGLQYSVKKVEEHLQAVIDEGDDFEWWPIQAPKEIIEANLIEVEG